MFIIKIMAPEIVVKQKGGYSMGTAWRDVVAISTKSGTIRTARFSGKAICMCGFMLHAATTASVFAQAPDTGATAGYPSKPIRLIIPFPPGGSNDIVGRYIGSKLSEQLGRQVVVDNRAGADGIIGSRIAASAVPDGHTLLVISTAFPMNAAIHKLPYEPLKSFSWVAMLGSAPTVLVANPAGPASSVKDLVAYARANPGKLMYASSGIGGFNHFAGELFRSLAGIKMVHVPFKGGGPAMIGVISGDVPLIFASTILSLPHVRSGKLRVLGTGGTKRISILPDVPTISESGVPGYEASNWWGMLGPAAMPERIVNRINAEIATIMTFPETQKRFALEGAEPMPITPGEFGKLIAMEIGKWTRVAKDSGIRAE